MIAVNEINIGVAGGAKEDGCARSITGGGMSRWILFAEVGLRLRRFERRDEACRRPGRVFFQAVREQRGGGCGRRTRDRADESANVIEK